ncbi:MAG: LysR family transcriptional regulator [Bdellovibrionales bacterium]|nr:LysR family transcriptional regulator [Bdellovibrionales bacterium]
MSLNSDRLDAFTVVAKHLNFSEAANALGITQPALTRRIQRLEEEVGQRLFFRNQKGTLLTESGLRLLEYTKLRDKIEEQVCKDIGAPNDKELTGQIRIAGYSAIMHPVIIPSLQNLLISNPKVQAEFIIREVASIPILLNQLKVDFIITDFKINSSKVTSYLLGHEELVAVEHKDGTPRSNTYLDVDFKDNTTEKFFLAQKKSPQNYHRSYFNDDPGFLNGVLLKLGRAILPKHTILENSQLKILNQFQSVKNPVYLHYLESPYLTRLQKLIQKEIIENCQQYLLRTNK